MSASCSAFDASKYSTNKAYFDSRLTITRIESYITPISGSFDFGNLVIKSIITVC